MSTSAKTLPEITEPDLYVIERISGPDALGRWMFYAYWLDNNVGYYLNQVGTRGQVFNTDLAAWTAAAEARGARVVMIEDHAAAGRAASAPDCPMGDPDCEGAWQLDPDTACHDACETPAA